MERSAVLYFLLTLFLALGCGSEGSENTCVDRDEDGYGSGQDCLGPDCNDGDETCHEGECCSACTDLDGDGHGVGDDCDGPDCEDTNDQCWEGACCPLDCVDNDGDGYGVGEDCTGPDCRDMNDQCWEGACCPLDCVDNDGDGYGVGEDCTGPDCRDMNDQCWEGTCCADPFNCAEIVECMVECTAGDMACYARCYELGDPEAQGLFEALYNCIEDNNCAFDDRDCILQNCLTEGLACYNDS